MVRSQQKQSTHKYSYDAEGKRVAKESGGAPADVYYYDIGGHMAVQTAQRR
ncbi:MAG TPA: hypothetical protein VHX63_11195 [Acidobacteriaceae bacterium]|jgi:hypothetical protein|nr:hypothetical protein [Acidobacteriaceae bacterium]